LVLAATCLAAPAGALAPPRIKPPAPGPAFVAPADLARLEAVKDAVARRRFAEARALARDLADPTARSLAEWYYFDAGDPMASIAEADDFLDAHPEWPSADKIQAHVESRLTWTTPPETTLSFFDTRDPLTGEGKLHLARAELAVGAADAATLHFKDAWINHNFILADEQRLIANYGRLLDADDHAARVDRLLWSREVTTARRVFARLRPDDRRRAEARAALLLGGADGRRLYANLSAEDRADAGVMLAAIRYFRRAEEEPRAIAIARTAPADPALLRNPARWWDEQQLLMRWALKNRQYADAYAMAAQHALDPGTTQFAEAEFAAGWIALRFLNDPTRAERHFGALASQVTAPISVSRGWYWLARAAEAKGETNIAERRYGKAAEQIYTFYGQLAAERIGGPALARAFEPGPPATPEEKATFGSRPAVAALRMLTDLKDDRAFLIFAFHIDDALQSAGEFRELADLALRANAPHVAVRAAKVGVRAGVLQPDLAYPDIGVPNAAARYVAPEIILGLSRQESEFNPRAYSRAGARGLMQLIPSTAQATARKERIPYRQSALLDDPHYNMTLGSAHLAHLIERYGGSLVLTFAAYNAGVNRVAEWLTAYGDPRSPGVDPLDWIEQIPFEETRNYVQRVLENSQIYRSRIHKNGIAGALAADIERGGPARRIAGIAPISAPGAIPDVSPRIAALAEPLLSPLTAAAEALAHIRVKPPRGGRAFAGPEEKAPARGVRLPRFQLRRSAPPPDGAHDEPSEAPPVAAAGTTPATAESALAPLIMAPVDSALEAQVEAEPVYADEALVDAAETGGLDESCVGYTDFIAATAKEEASADDLNAGALAELRGGASGCD
jgi:soluble lytic murein transglycosylase